MAKEYRKYGLVPVFFSLLLINCTDSGFNTTPDSFNLGSEPDAPPICWGTVYEVDEYNNVISTLSGAYILVRTWPGGCESYGYCYSGANGYYKCYNITKPPYFNYEGTYCNVDCSKPGYYSQTVEEILLPHSCPLDFGLLAQ